MKKIFTLLTAFVIIVNTSNAALDEPEEEKKETLQTYSPAFENAPTSMFLTFNRKDLERLSGRRLTLGERLSFAILKKADGKRFKRKTQSKGFNAAGFFIPLLLGIIGLPLGLLVGLGFALSILTSLGGVALMYAISKDKNKHKWAWIGFGAYIVGLIVLIILIITSGNFG